MKIEKSKNATRNIVFGTILKMYDILLPFVMRTVMVHEMGAKYLGLNSLFVSVLQVLNLAELGVGSAMVFSMYRPIAEDDTARIRAYMRLYKIYYRVIGLIILVAGLVITPFIPRLIRGTVPDDINVYILYLLNLGATVVSYWLFAYRTSILHAHQRGDVISKIRLGTNTLKYLLQFLVLVLFHNYYYYVLVVLLTNIATNIVAAIISAKMYPQYYPEGALAREEVEILNHRVRDLFTSKLGGTIVSSADTIIISSFIGLEALAIYQNYYHIMTSVLGFMSIIHGAIIAGVGNNMIVKSARQNEKEFCIFSFLVAWVSAVFISCLLVLYQPFMRLWMGSSMMLDYKMVVLFCIYFWTTEIVRMVSVYKDAGGIWHEDRFRPLISGLANLTLNLLMVRKFGLYGIILSTVLSMAFISIPWIINNVFSLVFHGEPRRFFILIATYSLGIAAIGAVCALTIRKIPGNGVLSLAIKGISTLLLSNLLFILLFRRNSYYKDAKNQLQKMLHLSNVIQ